QPKFNVLLRDDKTYPYIRFTAFEKYPRVYVTRRLRKDGSIYFGPFFPHSLAYRIVHFIHKHFRVPSCTVDLTRPHPRPCLQYYIQRCWGPCVPGLASDEKYAEAARDTRTFLDGRRHDLLASLRARMMQASEGQRYEQAAGYRDLLHTLEEIEEFDPDEFLPSVLKQLYLDAAYLPRAIHVLRDFSGRVVRVRDGAIRLRGFQFPSRSRPSARTAGS